jgi:hypothetical protein
MDEPGVHGRPGGRGMYSSTEGWEGRGEKMKSELGSG